MKVQLNLQYARIAFFMLALCAAFVAPAAEAGLFGSSETYSNDLAPFNKWNRMLLRHQSHLVRMKTQCETDKDCVYNRWVNFLTGLKSKSPIAQLDEVNRYMNSRRYTLDSVNWGIEDYWETPYEFFLHNGDCEDYAIAKYMTLRLMGYKIENLRVVVLQDNNLGVVHSVLAVYEGGAIYILDNQLRRVVKDTSIRHYTPVYSINEEGWWRHRS